MKRSLVLIGAALMSGLVHGPSVTAQSPKHELRGAWVATVINLDWPSSSTAPTAVKVAQLRGLLDELEESGINTVFFQVRTECDALYDSPHEPWSVYLTGQQGRTPDPYFDPLELAVDEAHARGMALHAWLNPFRCEREVGRYTLAANHPLVQHPDWGLTLESSSTPGRFHTILNPGLDAVHEYVATIVEDVVRRYDIDGVHFDDYFYPYPPYQIGASDLATFDADPRGFLNLDDWRRDNINRFVATIGATVAAAKPDVVFGISPFGIWRSGVPPGIVGLSGADALFADAVAWLQAGSIDYVAPQLYWPFGGSQDFAALADWWVSVSDGRHVYPGLADYRADPATAPGTPFALTEIPAQVRFSRSASGIDGNIHFRAQNLVGTAVGDSVSGLYPHLAIQPPMAWRDLFPPDPVDALRAQVQTGGQVFLEWDPSIFGFILARSFAVYRAEGAVPSDPRALTQTSEFLVGRSYGPTFVDSPNGGGPFHYVVTALSANHAESAESNLLTVNLQAVAVEPELPVFSLEVYPNPASRIIRLELGADGARVELFDALGRRVLRQDADGPTHELTLPAGLSPGLYTVRATSMHGVAARAVVVR